MPTVIVSAKKSVIKRQTRQGKIFRQLSTYKNSIKIFLSIMIFIVLIAWGISSTIFSETQIIRTISFSPESLTVYNDIYVYDTIHKEVIRKNRYMVQWNKSIILDKIQKKFPFVQDITIDFINNDKVLISVQYLNPILVIKKGGSDRAIGSRTIWRPLYSGDTLGNNAPTIYLPEYTNNIKDIEGIFFRHSPEELLTMIYAIRNANIIHDKIEYIIGSDRIAISLPTGRVIYFSINNTIQNQIADYKQILTGEHAKTINRDIVGQIDIGSLSGNVIFSPRLKK